MKAKETVWLALIGGLTAIAASTTALAQSAQPTGACIIEETTCIDVPQEVCDAMGGVYLGDSTDCESWLLEPLPTGACCFADRPCEELEEPACFAAGGDWSGPGSECPPDGIGNCEGACCLFEGDCQWLTRIECEELPGARFMGNNISCDSVVCRVIGACCLPDGTCQDLTFEECVDANGGLGGVYQGWGTECITTACTGACCIGDCYPSCVENVTWNHCECEQPGGMGGNFLGYGSTCDQNFCLALVEEQAYSFVQLGQNREFTFNKFDTLGDLRELQKVIIEVEGSIILVAILDNRGNDTAIPTGSVVTEELRWVNLDLPSLPALFDLINYQDFAIECFPPLIAPGGFCAFNSPYTFPLDSPPASLTVTIPDPDHPEYNLADFRADNPGDSYRIILYGYGSVINDGIGEGAIVRDPHVSEGLIRVLYQFSPVFSCSIDGPLSLCPEECDEYTVVAEDVPAGAPDPTFDWFINGNGAIVSPPVGDVVTVCGDDTCDGQLILTVEVRVGELCNTCEYIVQVGDLDSPEGTPGTLSEPCYTSEADACADAVAVTIWTDNCTATEDLDIGCEVLGDPCDATIRVTATDECFNVAYIDYPNVPVDDEPPAFVGFPVDEDVACVPGIPAPDPDSIGCTDNCGVCTVTWEGDIDNGGSGCPGDPLIVTRTYRVTDGCGLFVEQNQTITALDDELPTFDNFPPDVDLQCVPDIPAPDPDSIGCTDNCGVCTVTWEGDIDNGGSGCPGDPLIITRTYRVEDLCGNFDEQDQTITVLDDTPPTFDNFPPDVDLQCVPDVPAPDPDSIGCTDNCGVCTVTWERDIDNGGSGCPGDPLIITRTYRVEDLCGNFNEQDQTITVLDDTLPQIICPPDQYVGDWTQIPLPDPSLVVCTDNCGDCTVEFVSDVPDGPQECPFTVVRTYKCTDACQNESTCQQRFICGNDHPGCNEKGSLVVFSKVEIRWDASGYLLQDTFVQLTNDYPGDVWVKMYFINGDEPLEETADERAHLGWNWVDNMILITSNQPVYWSALTGLPANGGVSPFTILDPGDPPGRPAMDGTTDRVLRGYILVWAVNAAATDEIKWNHLAGNGTLVHYGNGSGWEYKACAFQVVDVDPNDPWAGHGQPTGTPGVLSLDGIEYDRCYDLLLLNFQAVGSAAFSQEGAAQVVSNTDLTLHPLTADLRQNNDGPVATKADFEIWNQWEAHFSTHHCIAFWDQTLLEYYGIPNNFLIDTLQTDHGSARIDAVADEMCDIDLDNDGVPDIISQPAALLGLSARLLTIDGGLNFSAAGTSLFGMGAQGAVIRYDVESEVPPGPLPPNPSKSDLEAFIDQIIRQYGGAEKGE